MGSGSAAGDFGGCLGGEAGASPQRAVMAEPTPAAAKSTAARRVLNSPAAWLRCSSVTDPTWVCSLVTSRHPAGHSKTEPLRIFSQTLIVNLGKIFAGAFPALPGVQALYRLFPIAVALPFFPVHPGNKKPCLRCGKQGYRKSIMSMVTPCIPPIHQGRLVYLISNEPSMETG